MPLSNLVVDSPPPSGRATVHAVVTDIEADAEPQDSIQGSGFGVERLDQKREREREQDQEEDKAHGSASLTDQSLITNHHSREATGFPHKRSGGGMACFRQGSGEAQYFRKRLRETIGILP